MSNRQESHNTPQVHLPLVRGIDLQNRVLKPTELDPNTGMQRTLIGFRDGEAVYAYSMTQVDQLQGRSPHIPLMSTTGGYSQPNPPQVNEAVSEGGSSSRTHNDYRKMRKRLVVGGLLVAAAFTNNQVYHMVGGENAADSHLVSPEGAEDLYQFGKDIAKFWPGE